MGPRPLQWTHPKLTIRFRCLAMLRLCLSQSSNPAPCNTSASPSTYLPPVAPNVPQARGHFLQININGILNSHQQLLQLLRDQNILIACIQETKLTATSVLPPFPNYAVLRKDRPLGRGGGLITLVHHSVTYRELHDPVLPGDNVTELQSITVEVGGAHLIIRNIYIPPPTSCPSGYLPDFGALFSSTEDILIMGDFNAHDDLWYSSTTDTVATDRGAKIVEALETSTLMVLNQDSPTRMSSNGPMTSPDLTITNSHMGLDSNWQPLTTLNSDHLPILVDLDGWFSEPPPAGPCRYTNFRKADWETFTSETEQSFNNIPPPSSCDAGELIFRKILLKATRRNIPQGKIPDFTPGLTEHARSMIAERDRLRAANPADVTIHQLEARIDREIERRKQEVWRESVESCSTKHCSGKYFKILRDLTGKRRPQDPNQPITFLDKTYSDRREIATRFVKQYTRPAPHAHDHTTRQLIRTVHKRFPLNHTATPFTTTQVHNAIRVSKNSTAPSADGLTIHQLKHLGPLGIRYLTNLFNLSYQRANLPAIWKHAIILPILKPGKPKDQGPSYRPISILCPASKVLEKLMHARISPHLPLAETQHGYRPCRSTVTALLPLAQQVVTGFNQECPPRRTVAMAVDFSQAFDTVNHTTLLCKLLDTTLPPNDIRWLFTYLRGRTASCSYNRVSSPKVILHQGVPQGSILSPVLFNFYVSTYPSSSELSTSYADDFTAGASDTEVDRAAAALAEHAGDVADWAHERSLLISARKSTVTLFTPEFRQSHLHPTVPMNGTPLPLERHPKILGVTFDPHFRFHKHVEAVVKKAKPRLNILKLLTGTDWGQQKETILVTFKSLVGSLFTYAAPIWFANTSYSSINRLQVIQNSALRIATGCVKMTPIDHLHTEAKVLKVDEHLKLLCSQHLATCLQPNHVSLPIVTADSGPRRMKQSLQTGFRDQVNDLLVDGNVHDIKTTRKVLHTRAVQAAIRSRRLNGVLSGAAPEVDQSETELPRIARTTLAQLRSGYCSALETFRHRINLAPSAVCPCCRQTDHTTQHLFSCPEHPTTLTPLDLWQRPGEAVEFLSSWPCFDRIHRARPPPEPPPTQSEEGDG